MFPARARKEPTSTFSNHHTIPCKDKSAEKTGLPCRHGLGDESLELELLLLEILGRAVGDVELGHGLAENALNLLLLAALHPNGKHRVRDDLLNTSNVRLELLLSVEPLAESIIGVLELLGVWEVLV